ncbi:hypothetical protein AB4Z32_11790 [Massilia sp. 2TAF26]|uniref:hypothetical protein n=1 Tax=Massilia sp. 2TAF26 TaxID=3233012 RepID=UPI003F94A051
MAHISLVLPFALPVPEFAPDLIRALDAPALAALLSRSSSQMFRPLEGSARVLPHELWIARSLGLANGTAPGFATSSMRGYGLDPGDGTWFIVNPAHIQIAHSHLMMGDTRRLDLREDEARGLFDSARACCEEAGHALLYGAPDTWFLRADTWDGIQTASPDAAVGMNLTDWVPAGAQARAFRKLQNEVQVNWYTHPVNAAREARGQAPINSIWPWGASSVAAEHALKLVARAAGKLAPQPAVATYAAPGWLTALADQRLDSLDGIGALIADGDGGADKGRLLVCGNAAAAAIAADWHAWLQEMHTLEQTLFAPLLAALKKGRIKALRLVLSHRDGHLETTTTPMAQRKFWRRPTLEHLKK